MGEALITVSSIILVVAGLTGFLVTHLRRRRMGRNLIKVSGVAARIESEEGWAATALQYSFLGNDYMASDPNLVSMPTGHPVDVWVDPLSGGFIHLNTWTENHLWGYWVGVALIVAGLTVGGFGVGGIL